MIRLTARTLFLTLTGLGLACAVALGITVALVAGDLPDVGDLSHYQPKQSLRVFTSDGVEIGDYGAERRHFVPIAQIPKMLQEAVIAVEDERFREHAGIDPRGTLRAALANLAHARAQGGSTITQQVARTFFLSSRKTYKRKLREALLALKIEHQLGKDQVLELYMNQIYLGEHAYGFDAAARVYFGKPMAELSVAECAMLAGLPQNPAYANPIVDFERARQRQLLVLQRMRSNGLIDDAQLAAAREQPLHVMREHQRPVHAEYVAEMARQAVYAQYGERAYTLGLKVVTSIRSDDQQAAWHALRAGLIDHDRRHAYRGPEDEEKLPDNAVGGNAGAAAQVLADYRDDEDLRVAVVTEAHPQGVVAVLADGRVLRLAGAGLRLAQAALSPRAPENLRIRRGSVIRVLQGKDGWSITQWPQSEGALVSLEPDSGRVRALVGGFDFEQSQFNHVTQAWRQPGSTFKPFLYSAALEHGVMPATLVNDAPPVVDDPPGWSPRNADDQYDGPITLRQALARSKNAVSVRLVQMLGVQAARDWAGRFGFDAERQPDNLTLALGAGSTTPLQLAGAYAVIANGGYRVQPVVIERVLDAQDKPLFQAPAEPLNEAQRAIPERNAFVTAALLQEVTRTGTAARAQAQLRRADLYGKTGTTNDAVDAWFAGFQPSLVAVVWMGYDDPQSLGAGESGGGLALPAWIDYMGHVLKGQPERQVQAPEGVTRMDDDWVYDEWATGARVVGVGEDSVLPTPALAASSASP
jgi:penicillin-binding protein 1A